MAFRIIDVLLTADSSSLRSQLLLASKSVSDFDRATGQASDSTNLLGTGMRTALAVGAAAVVAGFAYAGKAAADFETQMRNVNSIAHESEAAFNATSAQVLALSRTVPQSATTLAKGLYDIASSGFQGAEGMKVLQQSAIAASAGMTTTANSAKAITAVLNAYGFSAKDAARVSDVLFQTVNVGVLTFEDLTQNLGDVVGTAAAAGISINEVGSAVATMTRAGVPAAEAFTSLNRLTTSLIKPSDELAVLYKELGINIIPALKDPAIGLHGVMEQLRVATGGNVEAFLKLFPEIRAARGAFALASNDGKLYAEALSQINDQSTVTGATQRAFDEQMKATSAQFKLYINDINAGLIELGAKALPVLVDVMKGSRELGSEGIAVLQAAIERLAPFFSSLVDIGGHVGDMLKSVATDIGPLAEALGKVVGTTAIAALNGLGAALSGVTGFLADHPALVEAVAIAYGVHLVGGLVAAAVAFANLQVGKAAFALAELRFMVMQQVESVGLLGTALQAVPFLFFAGAAILAAKSIQDANHAAAEMAKTLREGLDLKSAAGLAELAHRAQDAANSFNFSHGLSSLKEIEKAALEAAKSSVQLSENTAAVSRATGLSAESVEYFAKTLGVDLTQGFKASEGARQKIIDNFRDTATTALGAGAGIRDAATISIDQLKAMADASDKAAEAASKAFLKDFDLIAGFASASKEHEQAITSVATAQEHLSDAQQRLTDQQARYSASTQDSLADQQAHAKAVDNVADAERSLAQAREKYAADSNQVINAEDRLKDARQALADLEARQSQGRQVSISDSQALSKAEKDVADALKGVADAQGKVASTSLTGFFAEQQREALAFVTNVSDAAARGLDPHLIASLLEAGPKAAAPFLQAIAADHSGALIGLANTTQAKLNELSATTVEISRVTQRAINATNVQMAGEYETAMQILAAKAKLGAKATAENIATELNIGVDKVRQIATDYVIVLSTKTDDAKVAVSKNAQDAGTALWFEYNRGAGLATQSISDLRTNTNSHLSGLSGEVSVAAHSIADGLVNNIEPGVAGADFKIKWLRDASGANLNIMAVDALDKAQAFQSNLYHPIERGVGDTDFKIKWFRDATGKNLNDLLQFLGGQSQNILQGLQGPSNPAPGTPPPNSIANGPLFAEGGPHLPRDATRGTGKTKVQWDEPETGGEWFLPDIVSAPSKKDRSLHVASQMLDRWGFEMVPKPKSYLYGGQHGGRDEDGFDRPPEWPSMPFTWPQADEALGDTYEAVHAFVKAAKAAAARRGGGGYGFQALIDYLNRLGIPNTVTSTTGGGHAEGSRHYMGLAADFVSDNMAQIGDAFMAIQPSMYELIHNPGYSVKGGRQVDPSYWGDDTWANHASHVHAATFTGPSEGPGIPGGGGGSYGSAPTDAGGAVALGQQMAAARGWTGGEWNALYALWQQESSWDANAVNPSSGAYGIPQALPAAQGHPYELGDAEGQIRWGLDYIAGRYGGPIAAEDHEQAYGWYGRGGFHDTGNSLHYGVYDQGGPLHPGLTMAYNGTGRSEWVAPMPVVSGAGGSGSFDYKALAREIVGALRENPMQVAVDSRLEIDGVTLARQTATSLENHRRSRS